MVHEQDGGSVSVSRSLVIPSGWAPDEALGVAAFCPPVCRAAGISSCCVLTLGVAVRCPLGFWFGWAGLARAPWRTPALGDSWGVVGVGLMASLEGW